MTSTGKRRLRSFYIRVGDTGPPVQSSPVEHDAIERIAELERCKVGELYEYVDHTKEEGVSRATAIRDFALRYFMEAGTAAGHRKAGHGKLIGKEKKV